MKSTLGLTVSLTIGFFLMSVAAISQVGIPRRSGTAEGTVINAVNNSPVIDVTIVITAETGQTRTVDTDENGRFSVSELTPGEYSVTWSRVGFVRPQPSPLKIRLIPGQMIRSLQLKLTPTGTITGRVLDSKKEPKDGLSVVALLLRYKNGHPILLPPGATSTWTPGGGAKTDENGDYRLFGLEPGNYYIGIWNSGSAPPLYYPGVHDPADAQPLFVGSGVDLHVGDIELRPQDLYTIRFKAIEPTLCDLTPVPRIIQVVRQSRKGFSVSEQHAMVGRAEVTLTGNETRVSARVSPGTYDIYYAFCHIVPGPKAIGRLTVHVIDTDVDAGTVVLQSSVRLDGVVRNHENASAPLRMELLRVLPIVYDARSAWLLPFLGNPQMSGMRVDRNGTFSLSYVAPGRYHFSLLGLPADFYVASIHYGSREVLNSGVEIDEVPPGPIEFILDAPGGIVEGVVRTNTGEAVANTNVQLIPTPSLRENPDSFKTVVSDQNGTFLIRGIPPGEYGLLAVEKLEPGAYQNDAVLKELERHAIKISVQKASRTNRDVRVIQNQE